VDLLAVNQPDEDFVDQRRGLQRVAGTLAIHLPPREPAQLVLHERYQLVEGLSITAAPGLQQCGRVGTWIRDSGLYRGLLEDARPSPKLVEPLTAA
jgi:hypothetical protein